jgi:hypothetical protein
MELLTQNLPSGNIYPFSSIQIKPMFFAQILEYMENVPSSPVEKFYFDYKVVLKDDPNIDHLLLCDLEYVVFFKKCLTISKDLEFTTHATCPDCGSVLKTQVTLSRIEFNHLDQTLLNGLRVDFEGNYHNVRMPTVKKFMEIFSKYRLYKRVADMNIIKLISLFEGVESFLQKYENMVVNATYNGISVLASLNAIYYRTIKPLYYECEDCKLKFDKLNSLKMEGLLSKDKDDPVIIEQLKELQESKYGGTTVGIDDLIVNFFRDVVENNGLTYAQIIPREIRKDE